jgi:hypothetical protein
LVQPDEPREWKFIDRWPNTKARNTAFETFKLLSKISSGTTGIEQDDEERPFLRFSDEAQESFNSWLCDLMRELRSGGIEHPLLQSHFTKYRKLVPALSLIFHLCDQARSQIATGFGGFGSSLPRISLKSAQQAAAWCEYLWEHAQRIYGLAIGYSAAQARTIAEKLQAGQLADGFTSRDVWRKNWSGLDSPDAVRDPLDHLCYLNWLESVEIRNPAGGRPTVQYLINPRIREVKL